MNAHPGNVTRKKRIRIRQGIRRIVCLTLVVAVGQFLVATSPAATFPRTGSVLLDSPGCQSDTVGRGDNVTRGPVPIGFEIALFEETYDEVFVRNDGIVTFNSAVANFPGGGYPSIAPFFANVDTSNPASGEVHFGQTTYKGRRAFCVDWFTRNADGSTTGVGYSENKADKLNTFQLLIVSTADPALPNTTGAFDVIFNYDKIAWDSGEPAAGANLAGCASAGYSDGDDDPDGVFAIHGSAQCGSLLDANPDTGLSNTTNVPLSLPDGRWMFNVSSGSPPGSGSIAGRVTNKAGAGLEGAPVTACMTLNAAGNRPVKPRCSVTVTSGSGIYRIAPLHPGTYGLTASSPAGLGFVKGFGGTVLVEDAEVTAPDIVLAPFAGAPPGLTLGGPGGTGGCTPQGRTGGAYTINWSCPTVVEIDGCPNGTGTWTLVVAQDTGSGVGTTTTYTGNLVWDPVTQQYKGTIPPVTPSHGPGLLTWTISCPGGTTEEGEANLYIDPSGTVQDTNGALIVGATTTLYWWNAGAYEFQVVPDGSVIMSPSNRVNPGITAADGRFAWDTLAGDYFVRAEAPRCRSPQDPSQHYADTEVVTVPPPALDLVILMWCRFSTFATTISHGLTAHSVTGTLTSVGPRVCTAGRRVTLTRSPTGRGHRSVVTTTNERGRFAFAHSRLPHGRYVLRASERRSPGDAGSTIKCRQARSVVFWL